MATLERSSGALTHAVTNQPPPLGDYNVFEGDRPLAEAVRREGADWAESRLRAVGELTGRSETRRLGALANENSPTLRR